MTHKNTFAPLFTLPLSEARRRGFLFFIGHFSLVIAGFGCGKAEGPIVYMDRDAVRNIHNIALLPITNATSHQEINPLLDQILTDEMLKLKDFSFTSPSLVREALTNLNLPENKISNPMDAKAVGEQLGVDGVMGIMLVSYTPIVSQIARVGTDTDVKAHTFEETKEELKERHGVLWGFLVDLLIPDVWLKGGEEYRYGTVTTDPLLGIGATMVDARSGLVIYQASKFLKRDARIPGAYKRKYEDIIAKEKFQILDFLARLSIRELIDPLKKSNEK